ncbi:GtrA family protein [uncultured Corynebacterium sp.]|uniref:GtrA family protein n=1 Tax=uncultured Corynebacterium sp. TaxID=159447 RepID=UPI0025ECB4DD|nr:GtrA family protein [uncultured Corynebacterium sp.]
MHKANDDSTSDHRDDHAAGSGTSGRSAASEATTPAGVDGVRAEKSATAPLADKPRDDHGLVVQMTRFIISGVIAAVVDFGLTFVMLNMVGASDFWGKSIGWVFGTITAYLINVRWTFKTKSSPKQVLAVAVLYLITYATQVGIFTTLNPWLVEQGWSVKLAQLGSFVVAQGVATVVNFIVQRTVIFKVK